MDAQSNEGGSEASQRPDAWWQRVGGLSGVPALMRALDMDARVLLAGSGLAADGLDRPDDRIPFEAFGRVLQSAADAAGYGHFGLTAGRMWHLEDLGDLCDVVRHSSSVAEALQSLTLYQHLNGEGGLTFTARHGPLVEVGYAIYYPGVVGPDQIYDFALASLFNYMRELCGQSWLPVQVLIPHAAPEDPLHYRSFFKVLPHFDTEICALRFAAHWLERPVEGADPARRRKALAAVQATARPFRLQQVYRALRCVLLSGRSSGDDVACALSMHRRTLNRRLQECGTTFQALLDEVRCEVARQLLCYSNVALDDVAASLGYAGVSPFMRSFRRWTGVTPGRMRRLALEDACGASGALHDAEGAREPKPSQRAGKGAGARPTSVRTMQRVARDAGPRSAARRIHA